MNEETGNAPDMDLVLALAEAPDTEGEARREEFTTEQAEQVFAAMVRESVEVQKQRALGVYMAAQRMALYKEHLSPTLDGKDAWKIIETLQNALLGYAKSLLTEAL